MYSKQKIEGTRNQLDPNLYPDVDWYGELFKAYTLNTKTNLNVNGGGDIAQYYLSVSHTKERGLLEVDPLNNFNNNIDIGRSNLRANINIKLSKTTKAAVKFYSLFERYNGPSENANQLFNSVMQANPVNFPKYFEKDETTQYFNHTLFGNKGNGGYPNPYAEMVKGYKDRFSSTILSQFQLEQDLGFITEGLKFRGMASVKNYSTNENTRSFTPFYYGLAEVQSDQGVQNFLYQIQEGTEYLNNPSVSNFANSNFYFELITEYNRTFSEKHQVGGLLVFNRTELLNTIGGQSAYSTLPSRNMGVSGRLTYAYDSRYFTEFNFGYNGSEKFAENHRFGFFPSAGLGWIVSNEPFFEKLTPVFNLLKLKYTYGLVGNDAISNPNDRFFYLSDVNINDGGMGYTFGNGFNNSYPGYIINRYPNPDVSWEISEKANYGLELGIAKKATLQVDYFTEKRTNIYMPRDYIPETMGLSTTINSNIGEAHSRGVDASLDFNHAFSGDFILSTRANFTYATNKVVKNGEPAYAYDYLSRIGHSINQQWGYLAERLFVDEEDIANSPIQFNQDSGQGLGYMPGDIKYTDVNGDGMVDELDRVPIGKPSVPEIVYGFGASASYKQLDMSFFFQGAARQSFFINPSQIAPFVNERNALSIIAENHWSDNNPDPHAFWPRLSTNAVPNNEKNATWWLRDGDFLRLKSVEIGYVLPEKMSKKGYVSMARFYLSGLNLYTFSKFKLWDPEMAGNGLGYPTQRVFNLGLQLTF
jgi:TonB-linked SusC/RagA family outer membrane protein